MLKLNILDRNITKVHKEVLTYCNIAPEKLTEASLVNLSEDLLALITILSSKYPNALMTNKQKHLSKNTH